MRRRRAALALLCLAGALPLIAADDSGCETEPTTKQGKQGNQRQAERREKARERKQRRARAQRRQRRQARQAAPPPAPEPQPANCDPNYEPCIPPFPPDLSCEDVGPVTVKGSDPHELDADGDGSACEVE